MVYKKSTAKSDEMRAEDTRKKSKVQPSEYMRVNSGEVKTNWLIHKTEYRWPSIPASAKDVIM